MTVWEIIIITELMTLWAQPWLIPTTGQLDLRSYRGMEKQNTEHELATYL